MGSTRTRVLIVEDEALIVMALKFDLEKSGYEVVDYVATGEEAVVRALEECPDVILMDVRLAGELDGVEAATRIRAQSSCPIIFMSGYAPSKVMTRAKDLRSTDFLEKPVDLQLLASKLRALVA
jgi:CheY-like chemotaxis protein